MVMNKFESTLSSALQAEAGRNTQYLDTAAAAHRLEAGLDRIDRDRRHRTLRTALTAAAAVLVAGGVYGVTRFDSGTTDEPVGPVQIPSTTTPSPSTSTQAYRMLVGNSANGVTIHADVALDLDWGASNFPVISDGTRRYGGLAVYQPSALAAGTGCLGGKEDRQVGTTPPVLAQQLAQLPRSTVLQSPTPVQAFGRHAVHLRLRINPDCGSGVYRVAETIEGGHGIYGRTSRHVVIDFWVENVGGVPVVIETWHQDGASSRMVTEIARAVKSLTFVAGG
jgi:hypothetical protein